MASRAALNGNSVARAKGGRAGCVASWPAARHLIGDPGAHEELDGGRGDREDGDRSDVVWLSPFCGSPRSARVRHPRRLRRAGGGARPRRVAGRRAQGQLGWAPVVRRGPGGVSRRWDWYVWAGPAHEDRPPGTVCGRWAAVQPGRVWQAGPVPFESYLRPGRGGLAGGDWWRPAVIYQGYPPRFADSGGDGVGDLPGITGRLDYLAGLGVDAVWLSPFYASPMADSGYHITHHCAVDPAFRTLAHFAV